MLEPMELVGFRSEVEAAPVDDEKMSLRMSMVTISALSLLSWLGFIWLVNALMS